MSEVVQKEADFNIDSIVEPEDIEDVIYSLMVNPNLSIINYFNDFSDEGIALDALGNTEAEEDSGFVEIDSNGQCVVMGTHAFHHHLQIDPQKATEILVSRATRRMLCLGVNPVAISAFLYHIDIADPNGHQISSGAKKGLENAASTFNLKISNRKIRFDRFTGHGNVPPTIILSMLGVLEDKENLTTHQFKSKGNNIFMIGRSQNDIGSSEYLEFYHNISESPLPEFDIQTEYQIQNVLRVLHNKRLITSASPVGKGGLFFTLMRAAFPNSLGFDITTDAEIRKDVFLFGEAMGRIIVGVDNSKEDEFVDVLSDFQIPFFTLGHVTKGDIRVDDVSYGYIGKMKLGN